MVRTKKELKINWSFSVQGYIFQANCMVKDICTHSLIVVDRGLLKQDGGEKR